MAQCSRHVTLCTNGIFSKHVYKEMTLPRRQLDRGKNALLLEKVPEAVLKVAGVSDQGSVSKEPKA